MTSEAAVTLCSLRRRRAPFPKRRQGGDDPEAPLPYLHAPGDGAIEDGVGLRVLWLRSQGCVSAEEALAEVPPGRDGSWR
jgi:hypothetical protein